MRELTIDEMGMVSGGSINWCAVGHTGLVAFTTGWMGAFGAVAGATAGPAGAIVGDVALGTIGAVGGEITWDVMTSAGGFCGG